MKKTLFFVLALSAFVTSQAVQITESQALRTASEYFADRAFSSLSAVKLKSQPNDEAPYYAFNSDNGGFVIVSGDNELTPIVGYSDSGRFDADNIPEALQVLLDAYADYVAAVQSGVAAPKKSFAAAKPVVAPLLTCKWGQDEPFNNDCPTDTKRNATSYTGCVATGMAQVMYYHKWPEKPQSYTVDYRTSSLRIRVQNDFSKSQYNWANMIDDYSGSYTSAQAEAVAKLMFDCGASVHMDYSASASGATDVDITFAMERFGYFAQLYFRDAFTRTQFLQIIKDELDGARPVIFCGTGSAGGHCFVADGYDSNNYLHINWGWGGTSDGYFDCDALNPDVLGAGGGAGGFNYSQSIVTLQKDSKMVGSAGLFPLEIIPERLYPGYGGGIEPSETQWNKGESVTYNINCIWNTSLIYTFTGKIALAVIDAEGNVVNTSSYSDTFSLSPSNVYYLELTESGLFDGLADGVYYLYPISKDTGKDDYLIVSMEDKCFITVDGDKVYHGTPASQIELVQTAPATINVESIHPGDQITVSIPINSSSTNTISGTLTCNVFNHNTNRRMSKKEVSVSLAYGDNVVKVPLNLLSSVYKNGETYRFEIGSFTTSSATYEVSSDFEPLTFLVGESSVERIDASQIRVYPNPVVDVVTVVGDVHPTAIEVVATDGRVVAVSHTNKVDMSALSAGLYILRLHTANGIKVAKVKKI